MRELPVEVFWKSLWPVRCRTAIGIPQGAAALPGVWSLKSHSGGSVREQKGCLCGSQRVRCQARTSQSLWLVTSWPCVSRLVSEGATAQPHGLCVRPVIWASARSAVCVCVCTCGVCTCVYVCVYMCVCKRVPEYAHDWKAPGCDSPCSMQSRVSHPTEISLRP